MTYAKLLEQLDTVDGGIISDLTEYYETPEALMEAIKDEDAELTDKVHEWADGQVSVYTGKIYEWINDNYKHVTEYEQDAIDNGATTIEKIGAYCWYMAEEAYAMDAISEAKKILDKE